MNILSEYKLIKIKYVTDIFGRIGFRGYTEQDLVEEGEGAITLSPSNIQDMKMTFEKVSYLTWQKYHESPEIKIYNGDILFVKTGSTYGKTGFVENLPMEATINPQFVVFKNVKIDKKLFFYICQTSIVKDQSELAVVGGTIPTMSQTKIGDFIIPCPPIDKQKAIADFLDKQCGKIDGIISDLEKQIDTLQKYKMSLILETVTKGLNKNAPMKSSGIDWIGDIPAHWETSKIKYNIGLIGSGTTPESGNPLYYEDGKYNWIQSGDLYKTDYIYSTEKQLTSLAIKDSPALTYYEKDFVVIAMYGASVGNVSISKIDAYTNQACCVIKAKKNDDIRYLFYYLKAAQDEMLLKAFGGTQPNISQIIIKNLNCLKVPNVEQKSISDYLDDKCVKIDSILKDKQEQLEKIKQHKKSLIYEYVTGKKRVKEANNGN